MESDYLIEWWSAPSVYGVGSTDCIVEGEILKLGGPFMQTWQKKHLRLFPNRLEFYTKTKDGIQLKGAEVYILNMLNVSVNCHSVDFHVGHQRHQLRISESQ